MSSNPSITKWSHLPNAVHIDRIIASLKSHPDQWADATQRLPRVAERRAVQDVTWSAAWGVSVLRRSAAWRAVQDVAWSAAWGEADDAEIKVRMVRQPAAWEVSRGALLCLVAYDDCAHMIDSEVGELKILAAFGNQRALMLLSACIALRSIKELQHAI